MKYAVFRLHCAVLSVQCAMCYVQCTLFSVQCALLVDKEPGAELRLYADNAEDNPVQSSAASLHCSTRKIFRKVLKS